MPVITEDDIRSLATRRNGASAVTSCYLDVDGSRYVRPADYERTLDVMLRRVRGEGVAPEVERDLARIEDRVRAGFDRSRVRGVAIFASTDADVWEVIELPVSVRSEVIVNDAPAVGQLEAVVQQAARIGLLCVDKVHARVFVFRLDELIEHTEITDDIGRDYDTVGVHDRGGVAEHREELEHQHVRHAADLLWSAYQSNKFDHVALAVPEHLASEVENDLHPYLRERLHSRLDIEPGASTSAIRDAVIALEARIEREREARLVEDLRAAVGSDSRGVAGLDEVLDALAEHRVDRLLVSDGFSKEGWRCPECNRLATVGRSCRCGTEMVHVDDIVEVAVDEALAQSCRVEVCIDNADLDVLGRVGALLRY